MKIGTPRYNRSKTIGYLLRCNGTYATWKPDWYREWDDWEAAWGPYCDRVPLPSAHPATEHDQKARRHRCLLCGKSWPDNFTDILKEAYDRNLFARHFERSAPFYRKLSSPPSPAVLPS
jgi:hypothetical protein